MGGANIDGKSQSLSVVDPTIAGEVFDLNFVQGDMSALNDETVLISKSKADSKHNIHWVKCQDCHTKGVPKKKV